VTHGVLPGDWDDASAEFDALVDLCADVEMRPLFLVLAAGALVAVHRGQPDLAQAALGAAVGSPPRRSSTARPAPGSGSRPASRARPSTPSLQHGTSSSGSGFSQVSSSPPTWSASPVPPAGRRTAPPVWRAMDAVVEANPGGATIRAQPSPGLPRAARGRRRAARRRRRLRQGPRLFDRGPGGRRPPTPWPGPATRSGWGAERELTESGQRGQSMLATSCSPVTPRRALAPASS
jgi:hypothetical protein